MHRPRTPYALLVALLLVAFAFLGFRIGQPWIGHQDENGAWISSAVRNYQRYGFGNLGGMVVVDDAPISTPDPRSYYVHHPPLAVWLFAAPVLLTGYHEALLRFVAIACTLLSAAILFSIARRLFGRVIAFWTLAFYLFTPMMLYFGRMPDHEAPGLLFLMLFAWAGMCWLQDGSRLYYALLVAATLLLAWTAWGALITAGGLAACWLIAATPRQRVGLFGIGAVAIAAVAGLLIYYTAVVPDTLTRLIAQFQYRSSTQQFLPGSAPFTLLDYLMRVGVRLLTVFTFSVLPMTLVGYALTIHRAAVSRRDAGAWMIIGITTGACAYLAVFRNASYIHDYYMLYLTPAMAMAGAFGLMRLWRIRPRRVGASRWLRPALTALLIVSAPILVVTLGRLHIQSDTAMLIRSADLIEQYTTADDLILAALANEATRFYTERALVRSRGDEISHIDAAPGRAFFITCTGYPPPPGLVAIETWTSETGCALIRAK